VRTFLGVDGGGTKTDFLLIDESGAVLGQARAGSAYYPQTGLDELEAMVRQGIRATLSQASLSPADVSFACVGLPAYGEDSALLPRLDAVASHVLPRERCRIVNDMVCGWAAALGCRDGINIVAGTGSIAYGEYATRSARGGGWGELFSDEGSAYWVAREALTLFSRMSDGRAGKAPLYAMIREHFRLSADLDVCAALYGPPPMPRSEIAALAPLVLRAVQAGDVQALAIIERAAEELAAIIDAVRNRLEVSAEIELPVSYSGGMFKLGNTLMYLLGEALKKSACRYELSAPVLSPQAGAALYAAKLGGLTSIAVAATRLTRTHGASSTEESSS
jgi:N-acetylglucosamine kinase-like BadF-type ATPase